MDRKSVEHIAHLAKLDLTPEELSLYAGQLTKILGFFEELSKVDTQGIEPLVTASEIEYSTREDEVKAGLEAEDVLSNAPSRVGNLYKVPPVV